MCEFVCVCTCAQSQFVIYLIPGLRPNRGFLDSLFVKLTVYSFQGKLLYGNMTHRHFKGHRFIIFLCDLAFSVREKKASSFTD